MADQPNVLLVMTDQQRFDTIGALGYDHVETPNVDRLVEDGVACTNAYTPAPICIPTRHGVRTGCDPLSTGYLGNDKRPAHHLEADHGPFLARAMSQRGYHTFGIGKFHAHPADIDLGYDRRLTGDDYAAQPGDDAAADTGRLAAMNFLPQTCHLAPEERKMAWIADEAVAEIQREDAPFFGFVSFSKPHPGWNPSPPFDDYYDPDDMPDAIREDRGVDHVDEKIPAQNYHFWRSREDDTGAHTIRAARAHYCGLITQLDRQIGRVLDAVEARDDADDTLVCLVSDHGELLGDHHGWAKSAFFEAAARVPFLLRWPDRLPARERYDGLVSLTDLFGLATAAAGDPDYRDGADLLGTLTGDAAGRERLFAFHETPRETDLFSLPHNFTLMVREGDWKYVYCVNGGREQLFDLGENPRETVDRAEDESAVIDRLRAAAVERLRERDATEYLDGGDLLSVAYERLEMGRYHPETYGPPEQA